jgi:hypothetical protein
MLGGESLIVCYVDDLRRAYIRHALLRVVEALLEQPEILGARWDEGSVTDDSDIVFAEGVSNAKQIPSRNCAIGIVPGATDFCFIRLFVQACPPDSRSDVREAGNTLSQSLLHIGLRQHSES